LDDYFYRYTDIMVAPSQSFALVGMAATLASVCGVPLTSVILLFEPSQDYTVIAPLVLAVAVASAIASPKETPAPPVNPAAEIATDSEIKDPSPEAASAAAPVVQAAKKSRKSALDRARDIGYTDSALDELERERVSQKQELSKLTVREAMAPSFLQLDAGTSVGTAARMMVAAGQDAAVVVDRDAGVMGVACLANVLSTLQESREKAALSILECNALDECVLEDGEENDPEVLVSPVMIFMNESLLTAIVMLEQTENSVLPVVDENNLAVGVIDQTMVSAACRRDITKALLETMKTQAVNV